MVFVLSQLPTRTRVLMNHQTAGWAIEPHRSIPYYLLQSVSIQHTIQQESFSTIPESCSNPNLQQCFNPPICHDLSDIHGMSLACTINLYRFSPIFTKYIAILVQFFVRVIIKRVLLGYYARTRCRQQSVCLFSY